MTGHYRLVNADRVRSIAKWSSLKSPSTTCTEGPGQAYQTLLFDQVYYTYSTSISAGLDIRPVNISLSLLDKLILTLFVRENGAAIFLW